MPSLGQPVGVSTKGRIRPGHRTGRARRAAGAAAALILASAAGLGGSPAAAQTDPTSVPGPSTPSPSTPSPSTPAPSTLTTPPTTTIRSQQDHVVTVGFVGPLDVARLAVDQYSSDVGRDATALAGDQSAAEAAGVALARAIAHLDTARTDLDRTRTALTGARSALALDRSRLRALALGMYVGDLTDPQPARAPDLAAAQEQVLDTDEADIVARQVDARLHSDMSTVSADTRRVARAGAALDGAERDRNHATRTVSAVAGKTRADQAVLASDRVQLARADHTLSGAEASLAAALASLNGPADAPAGQLSLLGGAALDARQLVAWYNSQGYVDLTPAPIQDLANWYIESGSQEGVRGDVAFAQAVLETGGFASPDATYLSNFAGIGHCDTCAFGWAFPSPKLGVLGHVQLLRIFADRGPGPPHAPPPVLDVLVPAQQGRAGCCSTVESLTGVWATDPTYGQQILEIYASMLASALPPA